MWPFILTPVWFTFFFKTLLVNNEYFILKVLFGVKLVLCYFKQYLDRRRQRNGNRQEEPNNDCMQTLNDVKEPESFVKNVLNAFT